MFAYLIILSTAIAGLLGASLWAAIACGCALALISIAEHAKLRASMNTYAGLDIRSLTLVASFVNGLLAGAAAYALGLILGEAKLVLQVTPSLL